MKKLNITNTLKRLEILLLIVFALSSCEFIKSNKEPVFDGSSQESFEKTSVIILDNTPLDKQEELKEAIGMIMIFGTGPLDDPKERKWERLRLQLHGMSREEVLAYAEKRAREDYN